MNILLINHYAGSDKMGMEFRPYYMAREWVKIGHKVTIVAASYSHLRKVQPLIERVCQVQQIDGIEYLWIKTSKYKSTLKRIFNIFQFVCRLSIRAKRIAKEKGPDLVINSSTYPLDIYPAKKIAKCAKAKLVYEIHDLWPLSPMEIGGYSKNHPFIKVMQKAEDDCYRYSDKVISLLWNADEHIAERGFDNVQFACVPNGYVEEEWNSVGGGVLPKEHSDLFEKLKREGKTIVGYAGGHTPSTALDTLIEAAEILKKNNKISFVLVGDGVSKQHLVNKTKEIKLNNIFFFNSVEKSLIPTLISNFDIAYMGGIHSILHKYGTSFNKMTDYMLSAKPIVFSADEPDSLVEKIGCGIRVEAENPKLASNAIEHLSNMTKKELEEMGIKGRDYAINNLSYSTLAKVFIDEIL